MSTLDARDEALLTSLLRNLLASLSLTGGLVACGWGCEDTLRTSTVTLEEIAKAPPNCLDVCTGTDTGEVRVPEDCPPGEDVPWELLDCSHSRIELVGRSGDECTYRYECDYCCAYGRPYLDETGTPVTSGVVADGRWSSAAARPAVDTLTDAERSSIGHHWLENGQAEHSSVAGFHRFALDLLAHGAPPELVLRAQQAAGQEVRHAVDCFSLASAYLGRPWGPAPLDLGKSAPIARSLAELAAWTARDGAIGETVAALLASRCLLDATDPAVRAVLERIVADETAHAELAWDTLRWALDAGGPEVADVVRSVFASLRPPARSDGRVSPTLAAHGVPDPEVHAALTGACFERVLGPVAAELLGQRDRGYRNLVAPGVLHGDRVALSP